MIRMGDSTCVACGECVQACPTGALMPKTREVGTLSVVGQNESIRFAPICGVGCQLTYNVQRQQNSLALKVVTARRITATAVRERPLSDSTTCSHKHRLTKPLIRKAGMPKDAATIFAELRKKLVNLCSAKRPGKRLWILSAGNRKNGIRDRVLAQMSLAGFGSREGQQRRSVPVSKIGAHRFRYQQCRPLHATMPRLVA